MLVIRVLQQKYPKRHLGYLPMNSRDGKATAVLPLLSRKGSSRLTCRLNNGTTGVAFVLLTCVISICRLRLQVRGQSIYDALYPRTFPLIALP